MNDLDVLNGFILAMRQQCLDLATISRHTVLELQDFCLSIEETKNFASVVLSSRFLMIHDTRARRQNDVPKLTRRQQLHNPLLDIAELHVETRRDDASLVESAVELDDYLAVAVVVDFFEFADVA